MTAGSRARDHSDNWGVMAAAPDWNSGCAQAYCSEGVSGKLTGRMGKTRRRGAGRSQEEGGETGRQSRQSGAAAQVTGRGGRRRQVLILTELRPYYSAVSCRSGHLDGNPSQLPISVTLALLEFLSFHERGTEYMRSDSALPISAESERTDRGGFLPGDPPRQTGVPVRMGWEHVRARL